MTRVGELLSARDRERLLERIRELENLEQLLAERGGQRPAPEPVPLCRPSSLSPGPAGAGQPTTERTT